MKDGFNHRIENLTKQDLESLTMKFEAITSRDTCTDNSSRRRWAPLSTLVDSAIQQSDCQIEVDEDGIDRAHHINH